MNDQGRRRRSLTVEDDLPRKRVLTPIDRAVRRPLHAWSRDRLAALGRATADVDPPFPFDTCREIVKIGNNAGLILTHAGRSADAERLCRRQITWLDASARRFGRPALRVLTVQPWVNLGRLHGLGGQTETALEHFREIYGCTTGDVSTVGEIEIRSSDWSRRGWAPEDLDRFRRSVMLVDSLRVLFTAGRFEEALELAEGDVAGDSETLARVAAEGQVVSLAALGDSGRASERARSLRGRADAWQRMVLSYRCCEALVLAGEIERARQTLAGLVKVCRELPLAGEIALQGLLIAECVTRLAALTGAPRPWEEVAGALARAGDRVGDRVLQIRSRRLLAHEAESSARRESARSEAERIAASTHYARLRRGDAAPSGPPAEAEELLAGLMDVMDASPGGRRTDDGPLSEKAVI